VICTQHLLKEVKDILAAWIRDLARHQTDLRWEESSAACGPPVANLLMGHGRWLKPVPRREGGKDEVVRQRGGG
jgi:hypothetical protein